MSNIPRISPRETRERVKAGTALLVCAYDDEDKFKTVRLEGALSLSELREREKSLPRDQEIIFYCA